MFVQFAFLSSFVSEKVKIQKNDVRQPRPYI